MEKNMITIRNNTGSTCSLVGVTLLPGDNTIDEVTAQIMREHAIAQARFNAGHFAFVGPASNDIESMTAAQLATWIKDRGGRTRLRDRRRLLALARTLQPTAGLSDSPGLSSASDEDEDEDEDEGEDEGE